MTDTKILNARIEELGIKKKKLAAELGITQSSLWQKMNNVREFKASEINALCSLLSISSLQDKEKIFFARNSEINSRLAN